MFNNYAILSSIVQQLDSSRVKASSAPRTTVPSHPVLPSRLPSISFLQREAKQHAPRAILRQSARQSLPSLHPTATSENSSATQLKDQAPSSDKSSLKSKSSSKAARTSSKRKDPEPFEIFRAVEKKDIAFLMEVRDRAFPLLLRKMGDTTPLLHAMRIGPSHRDVAIILLGAFSRWINHLQDEEMEIPQTKMLLRTLRANLRFAIDYGLARSQSDLTASFLQALVMSEGDQWVITQAHCVAVELQSETGKPVEVADTAVRHFATDQLVNSELIATVEDYIANATADLVMLGAWSCVCDVILVGPIPTYYFGRDDRVYKAFVGKLDEYKAEIQKSTKRRLRRQLRVLSQVLESRAKTYRSKVQLLGEELDRDI